MSYMDDIDKKIVAEMQEERQQEKQDKKKRTRRKIIGLIVLVIILLILLCLFLFESGWFSGDVGPAPGRNVETLQDIGPGAKQTGGLDMKNAKEIKAELQAKTDASYMTYKINVNPVFPSSKEAGNIMIENVKGNPYIVQVEIRLDKDGSVVYTSPVLYPDEHVQDDKLHVELKKGEHPAIAYFKCYDPETKVLMGESGMRIKITILS